MCIFDKNVLYINCSHPYLPWICQSYYFFIIVFKTISIDEYYMYCRKFQNTQISYFSLLFFNSIK